MNEAVTLKNIREKVDELDQHVQDMAYAITHLNNGIQMIPEVSPMTKEGAKSYFNKGDEAAGEAFLKVGSLKYSFQKGIPAGDILSRSEKYAQLKTATQALIEAQFYDHGEGREPICRGCEAVTADGLTDHAEGCLVGAAEQAMSEF